MELYSVTNTANGLLVSYAIFEGNSVCNVSQVLEVKNVLDFVIEEELNWVYIIAPDVISELDPATYLSDNLREVTKLYLEYQLKTVEE